MARRDQQLKQFTGVDFTTRYPFEGRPAPVPMVGLLSFHPTVYLKLFGINLQMALAEQGFGKLWRRVTRQASFAPSKNIAAKTSKQFFDVLAAKNDWPDAVEDLKRAAYGCKDAQQRTESRTGIEYLLLGARIEPSAWDRRHCHMVLMERAGTDAQRLLARGETSRAIALLESHPLWRAITWPGLVQALEKCSNEMDRLPATAAMALDANLGMLAAWDLDDMDTWKTPGSLFSSLLPSKAKPGLNPTRLVFDAFQRRLNVDSIPDILDKAGPVGVEIGTLYRWSSGRHLPDVETVSLLMQAHDLSKGNDIFYRQLSAAKFINFLGYMSQSIAKRAREYGGAPAAIWPWPAYPHLFEDFESWVAERYPFWLEFHRSNRDILADLAKTPWSPA
jgi:hypothetical protein